MFDITIHLDRNVQNIFECLKLMSLNLLLMMMKKRMPTMTLIMLTMMMMTFILFCC